MSYQTRYCAFVDILGFTAAIRDLDRGSMGYEELRTILRAVHEPPPEVFALTKDHDLRAQSISDAVCLSTACNAGGLSLLFFSLEMLTLDLLRRGFFIRGGVVKGKLYHDHQMVFGEALVDAYRLESTLARFPRIMITKEVRTDAVDYQQQDGAMTKLLESILQAKDGPYYLHALVGMARDLRNKNSLELYKLIATQIQTRFDAAVDNPRHFENAQWFATYWNQTLGRYDGPVPRILGPGVTPEWEEIVTGWRPGNWRMT